MQDQWISVGIDIGTTTTQVIFSRLVVENTAGAYAVPRFSIVEKEIIYESEIFFTPLLSKKWIDVEAVRAIVNGQYQKAGIKFEQVRTGAVIITGDTARKENASLVLENLSGFAGEFVVATAGPELESVLAGLGSGAAFLSKKNHSCIANVDIGGGTSNLAVFNKGKLVAAACLDLGGRLITVDHVTKKITYVYAGLKERLSRCNILLEEGMDADQKQLEMICDSFTKILCCALHLSDEALDRDCYTNHGLPLPRELSIDEITFSGGVASLIYQEDRESDCYCYGDIGVLLANRIRNCEKLKEIPIRKPMETIHATVVGAGMHTTQISGSTICYRKETLPVKNIPVLYIETEEMRQLGAVLKRKLSYYTSQETKENVAIAFAGFDDFSFDGIQKKAKIIYETVGELIAMQLPLILVIEADISKAFGNALKSFLPPDYPIICVDGIFAQDGDYVDIGNPIADGQVLPVVIKTLVFNT